MKATTVLSEFASNTHLEDISAEAVAATKRHILDCAGVALAATAEPAGRIVEDITREQGGDPKAAVLGTRLRTSVVSAAWANGAFAHLENARGVASATAAGFRPYQMQMVKDLRR